MNTHLRVRILCMFIFMLEYKDLYHTASLFLPFSGLDIYLSIDLLDILYFPYNIFFSNLI